MSRRERARRRQRAVRRAVVSAIWGITLCALALIIIPSALSGSGFAFGRPGTAERGPSDRPAVSLKPAEETPAASPATEEPARTPEATEAPEITEEPEAAETPVTTEAPEPAEEPEEPEEFLPVAASEAVGDDYFKDAVFIGDSRTQGLRLYSGLKDTTWLCSVGLTVEKAYTEKLSVDGRKLTAVEALGELAPGKVYIMLGLNEMGWKSTDIFIEKYGGIIDAALAANPEAEVYVESILPVSAAKDAAGTWCSNANVDKFNARLMQLAEEKGVNYLDVSSAVEGEDGCLPNAATPDGVHLTPAYCTKWMDYLKTHTVAEVEA